jgi:hypothetical protein
MNVYQLKIERQRVVATVVISARLKVFERGSMSF